MTFLYGDSSPSTLQLDYLDCLRRALALAVEILLLDDQLVAARRRRHAVEARGARFEERLEQLRLVARESVGAAARSPDDDPVTRCANHIERQVDDVVAREVAAVKKDVAARTAEVAARTRAAHAACVEAVDGFLRHHDLPGSVLELDVRRGERAGYAARLAATTPYEVAAELELDTAGSPFAAAELRAGVLVKEAEVQVPEVGGWLRKETRLTAVRLDRLLVVAARRDADGVELRLRASAEPAAEGFDLGFAREAGGARLTRIAADGTTDVLEPVAANDRALAALRTALHAALDQLGGRRGRLLGLTIDHTPLEEHERPSILVDRMFAAMAPEVRRIVQHSMVPGELTLRRQLGNERREEIFLKHSALAELLAQLPAARRRHFAILGLPGLGTGGPPDVEIEADVDTDFSDPSIEIDGAGD